MNIQYCTSCGFKNVYGAQPPNFCAKCGAPMSHTSVARNNANNPIVEEDEQEAVSEGIPNIARLEYEIQGVNQSKVTFEDLVRQGPSSEAPRSKKKGQKSKPPTQDKILKDSLDICKSAKFKPSDELE